MALPIDFVTRTRALLGGAEYEQLEQALLSDAPVSIRVNPAKGLSGEGLAAVPWSEAGFYLPSRLSFTFDPLFHAGCYYVQEASSMFLEQVVRSCVPDPVICLDLCAAPGGKSTLLHSTLPEGSLVVSNEVIRSRSVVLAENIQKWGYPNNLVTNNDPSEIGKLTHLFDVIVADVPCSGEGMFRKDTDSMGEWSVANVELCAARQRRILQDVWDALKPGGLLIYSTCTYNTEEDEENIHYIIEELGATPVEVPVAEAWKISGALKYDHAVYRFFPHRTKGEGFFLAALRKQEGEVRTISQKTKHKERKQQGKNQPTLPQEVKHYLKPDVEYTAQWQDTTCYLLPPPVQAVYPLFQAAKLRILTAGIEIGAMKGRDLIPAQSLAQSIALHPEAFPRQEVDWETAIAYLRKEALVLPAETPRGYVLLTYQSHPLGFVKNLGNRANNLYPQEWRIRSSYQPDEIKTWETIQKNSNKQNI